VKPEEQEQIQELVSRTAAQLGEHFDTVQIFVTRHRGEDTTTAAYEHGVGNFLARYGQVVEWLAMQDQYQRQEAKRRDAKDRE